jgi:hypothetical protein
MHASLICPEETAINPHIPSSRSHCSRPCVISVMTIPRRNQPDPGPAASARDALRIAHFGAWDGLDRLTRYIRITALRSVGWSVGFTCIRVFGGSALADHLRYPEGVGCRGYDSTYLDAVCWRGDQRSHHRGQSACGQSALLLLAWRSRSPDPECCAAYGTPHSGRTSLAEQVSAGQDSNQTSRAKNTESSPADVLLSSLSFS